MMMPAASAQLETPADRGHPLVNEACILTSPHEGIDDLQGRSRKTHKHEAIA
jgi:hypothetical protein